MALYLCKELPLSLWRPQPEEICVIGAWLLQHPLSAVENRLACVILEGLNWGYSLVSHTCIQNNYFLSTVVSLLLNVKACFHLVGWIVGPVFIFAQ